MVGTKFRINLIKLILKVRQCHKSYSSQGHKVTFNYMLTKKTAYKYFMTSQRHQENHAGYRYFNQFYQICAQYMWITPEKGYLTQPTSICWEQNKHQIAFEGRHLSSNELKSLGYLATEHCLRIIQVTHSPDKTPVCPRMDRGFNPGVCWLAPNGTY